MFTNISVLLDFPTPSISHAVKFLTGKENLPINPVLTWLGSCESYPKYAHTIRTSLLVFELTAVKICNTTKYGNTQKVKYDRYKIQL